MDIPFAAPRVNRVGPSRGVDRARAEDTARRFGLILELLKDAVAALVEDHSCRHGEQGGNVKTESDVHAMAPIEGHMFDMSPEHTIAIYKRDGVCWVAEFREGRGALDHADSWFRFHAGALRYSHNRRRAALQSSTSLTTEMLEKIERLHHESEARPARMLPAHIAAAARRYLINVISDLRGRAAKIGQIFG